MAAAVVAAVLYGGAGAGDAASRPVLWTIQDPRPACPEAGRIDIEVNIAATELTLYEDGVPLFRRDIAIGRGVYPTPQQATQIEMVEWNPWWFPPDAPWAAGEKPTPPGPANPMGLAKMPLSREILFHGTNQEWSVGRAASHGCMRMRNRDVTELAWFLQQRSSGRCDPALRQQYRDKPWRTFKVKFDRPVPVDVVYRPVEVKDGGIEFYRDHYGRLHGNRKAAILTEVMRAGYDIELLDEELVDELAHRWPVGERVPIMSLMRRVPFERGLWTPECS